MIIDCHGHYTTAPRPAQRLARGRSSPRSAPGVRRRRTRRSPTTRSARPIETNQLRLLRERGADLTIFSPRASAMAHHEGDERRQHRVVASLQRPDRARRASCSRTTFVGVCQLPQSPGADLASSVAELERCVQRARLRRLQPQPGPERREWTAPPLTDRYWYPLYEKMVELDVPAMVHVVAQLQPVFHATGAHYINADTTAFMQLIQGDLFADFPTLRLVIPHGGGAVPYHWGRYRGLAGHAKKPPLSDHVMKQRLLRHLRLPPAGHRPAFEVIDVDNILFGSEMVGAVRGIDPETGQLLRRHQDATSTRSACPRTTRRRSTRGNARRVYPRLDSALRDGDCV